MQDSYFTARVAAAEKDFSKQLAEHRSILDSKSTSSSLRILCPAAGLLPSLQVLLQALNRGYDKITVVCVEKADDVQKFIAMQKTQQGKIPAHKITVDVAGKKDSKTTTIFSSTKSEDRPTYELAIEYHVKDIALFLEDYSGPKFQIVYYENPEILGLLSLSKSYATRLSLPLLARVVSQEAILLAQTETRCELLEFRDLAAHCFPHSKSKVNSPSALNIILPFFPTVAYKNGFFAKLDSKDAAPTTKELIKKKAVIETSDKLIYPTAIIGSVLISICSPPFRTMNLLRLQANKTEWLSALTLILTIVQVQYHRIDQRGALKHLGILLLQASLLYLMNNNQVDQPASDFSPALPGLNL